MLQNATQSNSCAVGTKTTYGQSIKCNDEHINILEKDGIYVNIHNDLILPCNWKYEVSDCRQNKGFIINTYDKIYGTYNCGRYIHLTNDERKELNEMREQNNVNI